MVEGEFSNHGAALPFVETMNPSTAYVVTTQLKVKRTITGKYVSHDAEELILIDENGRFKRAPIDKIIRINFYHEDRSPF